MVSQKKKNYKLPLEDVVLATKNMQSLLRSGFSGLTGNSKTITRKNKRLRYKNRKLSLLKQRPFPVAFGFGSLQTPNALTKRIRNKRSSRHKNIFI